MAFTWKDKVVIITGASRGIGAHVVKLLLLEEGAKKVAILDVDEKNGVKLQDEINAENAGEVKFIKCDVTNEEQLLKTLEFLMNNKNDEYVLINNAAILNDSLRTYKKQIEINVTALITASLKALDLMRKDQGGRGGAIINISSVAALHPLPLTPIYNATKSAVMQFSTCLGMDDYYSRTDVRVITICFGATDTGLIMKENMGNFDKEIDARLMDALDVYPSQSAESAARGVVEAYKKGKSASVWLVNNSKPVEDITHLHKQAYEILAAPIFK